jgi:hypothetical protein
MVHQVKKRNVQHRESVEFVQHVNEEKKPVLHVWLVVWHFAKLHVPANITQRRITEQVHKNLIYPGIYPNISFKKPSWIITCIDIKNEFMLPTFFVYIL